MKASEFPINALPELVTLAQASLQERLAKASDGPPAPLSDPAQARLLLLVDGLLCALHGLEDQRHTGESTTILLDEDTMPRHQLFETVCLSAAPAAEARVSGIIWTIFALIYGRPVPERLLHLMARYLSDLQNRLKS